MRSGSYRTPPRGSLVLLTALLVASACTTVANAAGLAEGIRIRVEASYGTSVSLAQGERLFAASALPLFYERRAFTPAWVSGNGPLAAARELIDSLKEAHREGLRPADYHLATIEILMNKIGAKTGPPPPTALLLELELLCTDAYLIYGSHLLPGRINPETYDPEWVANRRGVDMTAHLETSAKAWVAGQRNGDPVRSRSERYAR